MKDAQARWALGEGLCPDAKGYVASLEANLFHPMTNTTLADFRRGGGGELRITRRGPAKMLALHSSSILACNVFDYWRANGLGAIGQALGIADPIDRLAFEAKFPTALPGEPPNLDVALWLQAGSVFAIESKFTEPYCPQKRGPAFKSKYFPSGTPVWMDAGLMRCGRHAQDLQTGTVAYRHLGAAQLLKHILGLCANQGQQFTLAYLYMDHDGPEGTRHRDELAQFAESIGDEVRFMSMPYERLVARLREVADPRHDGYFEYMKARYGFGRL